MASKKSVSIKARIAVKLFHLIDNAMLDNGFINMSEYMRIALIEKLARDTGKTVAEITKAVQS